jgi:hypothetical protein
MRQAAADAVRLERENAVWANALALLVRAGLAAGRDDRHHAVVVLRSAERALSEAGMAHYAAAARYRLGQLLGGADGRVLVSDAEAFFKQQTIVNVERTVGLLAPGQWSARAER